MHFDLTDMQLMLNISEAKSLTKGAERSFLSLPAASHRIKNLENQLGTALLNRSSQGVSLTPSGEVFVQHAQLVMHQIQHLRGDMQEFAEGIKGKVKVYVNTTAMNEFMPSILGNYLTLNPDVSVELKERLSYQVIRALHEGRADIGVFAASVNDEDDKDKLEFIPYRQDRLVLVVPTDHRLAQYSRIDFVDALEEEFVTLSEWSAIHAFVRKIAENLGRKLKYRVEVGGFEPVCRMVAAKVGISVVPATAALRYQESLPLHICELKDDWAIRQLYVGIRKDTELPSFAKALVELLKEDAKTKLLTL